MHSYNTLVTWEHSKKAESKRWDIFLESKFHSYSNISNICFDSIIQAFGSHAVVLKMF